MLGGSWLENKALWQRSRWCGDTVSGQRLTSIASKTDDPLSRGKALEGTLFQYLAEIDNR
ncbi:hypothetical protein OG21DRAFT_1517601 [Imleria badia]|nr:hypothetical protein OG21DRAFT_1517601 [Imleria badia]